MEIAARRLTRAAGGTRVESALSPGMVTMKTFDPPLDALSGLTLEEVSRRGKLFVIDFGELSLVVHLMSAGRLQLWDKRASLRDRASRLLVRLDDGRELRLREFGTQQRAWGKLLPSDAVEDDEAVAQGDQARESSEQRGLARAIGPEQAEHLAARDLEVEPVERPQRSVALRERTGGDRRLTVLHDSSLGLHCDRRLDSGGGALSSVPR